MPANPYGGGYYRGGGTGVGADFGLRDQFAGAAAGLYGQGQMNRQNSYMQGQNNYANSYNNIVGGAAGMATNGQIAQSRADLMPAYQGYQRLHQQGMYTGQQMNDILQNSYQQVAAGTRAMQGNANAMNASRGLGANAGMAMATGMAGQFAAAGARGQANAGLQREQSQSKIHGLDGMGNIGGQLADYASRPTQENALAMLANLKQADYSGMPDVNTQGMMDLYNQYRNATIGQDNANEFARERPGAPSYPQSYPNGYTPPAGPIQTGGGYSYGGSRPGGMPSPWGGGMGSFSVGGGMPPAGGMPPMGGAPAPAMGGAPAGGMGGAYISPGAGGSYNPYIGAPDRSTGQPINPATGMPYVAINPKTGRPYGPSRNVQVTALGDNTYAPKPTSGPMTHVWPPRRTF
jgi:hypothetical protein